MTNGVTFEWSSADTTRATVSASGLVSGVRLGATDVTALAVLNGTPTSVTSSAHAIRVRIATLVVTPATPAALNFVGAGVSCANNAGTSATDCTIGGGSSAAAAGSDTQVQFNDGGTLGGDAAEVRDEVLGLKGFGHRRLPPVAAGGFRREFSTPMRTVWGSGPS